MTAIAALDSTVLPPGIRARFVDNINGLRMHVLEAGFETPGRKLVLLLHGFPELAYSWRKVMLPLAAAGYHVIAPDQRGYGRTTGWSDDYDGDLTQFWMMSAVRDALALVGALGYGSVAAVIGHDFGSPVAAWGALTRPDVFRSVVMMSSPFGGPPARPAADGRSRAGVDPIHEALAKLDPPRKHYQWYYGTRPANRDMMDCPQGLHDFLRGYYHYKSADWLQNKPVPLKGWTAAELARMPTYYIMNLDENMAQTVAPHMPSAAAIAACKWMPDSDMRVYSGEYGRTGFQGGLQWYRSATSPSALIELQQFEKDTIDVPSCFIAGKSDWGIYQRPGAIERMQKTACTRMWGCHLVDGAGHWVQQEQPERANELVLAFLRDQAAEA